LYNDLDILEDQVAKIPSGIVEFSAEDSLSEVIMDLIVVLSPVGVDVPRVTISADLHREGQFLIKGDSDVVV